MTVCTRPPGFGTVAALVLLISAATPGCVRNGEGEPAPQTPVGTTASPEPAPQAAPPQLNLQRLRVDAEPLVPAGRDPFRFKPPPPPPPPPKPVPPPLMYGPPAPMPPPPPPPPPPIPLKFIGLVDLPSQRGRVAVLSDAKGNVFYGKEGDIIEGQYRVLRIGVESAELAYLDGRGRQVIRLSGQ